MPSWAPITVQDAPPWRALVTAAARVASAALACWWAVATQPRTSNTTPAGSGTGVWPLPRVERAALQDAHSATAPYWTVAVSVDRGRQQPVESALACHYAHDPARRPGCTRPATVQYGAVALCASCNAARSTLGKGQTPVPLPAGVVFDVLGWVATAHQQANAAEATLAAAVTRARQGGASWTVIGAQLGVSRQGAQQRFTVRPPVSQRSRLRARIDSHQMDSTTTQTLE